MSVMTATRMGASDYQERRVLPRQRGRGAPAWPRRTAGETRVRARGRALLAHQHQAVPRCAGHPASTTSGVPPPSCSMSERAATTSAPHPAWHVRPVASSSTTGASRFQHTSRPPGRSSGRPSSAHSATLPDGTHRGDVPASRADRPAASSLGAHRGAPRRRAARSAGDGRRSPPPPRPRGSAPCGRPSPRG